jgi:hypothetical protein
MTRAIPGCLAVLALAGCTVGPNYHKPRIAVPPLYRNAPPPQPGSADSLADLKWWEEFKDPVLQKLIRTGIERNYDVRVAAEEIIAARAQVALSRSSQLPQVTLNPSYTGGKTGESVPNVNTNLESLTADFSYALDLFGGLRRATEASRGALLATEEARRTILVTLVSEIGSDYYQLLALDLQLQIAKATVISQQKSVTLTKSRADYGVATNADWLQARQVTGPSDQPDGGRDQHSVGELSARCSARGDSNRAANPARRTRRAYFRSAGPASGYSQGGKTSDGIQRRNWRRARGILSADFAYRFWRKKLRPH